jgi:predicted transcriptional regulator
MTIERVREVLNAEVCCCSDRLDIDVYSACGSDLMSDVLAFVKDQSVLLTGLVNPQVIRTAEMMDMVCVVFVRGKQPDETLLHLARDRNIVVLSSPYRMYTACGLLYAAGLTGKE